MLYIITGDINSGKTTRMKALYHQKRSGADGIISEKTFQNGTFSGYRLIHLKSCKTMEFALLLPYYRQQFSEACRFEQFVFSAEAFNFGIDKVRRLCDDISTDTIFLDEVGPLEMIGQGFAKVLPALLNSNKNLYVTVRSSCLHDFLRKYKIEDYQLIHTERGYHVYGHTP